jgi:hypothetical protein
MLSDSKEIGEIIQRELGVPYMIERRTSYWGAYDVIIIRQNGWTSVRLYFLPNHHGCWRLEGEQSAVLDVIYTFNKVGMTPSPYDKDKDRVELYRPLVALLRKRIYTPLSVDFILSLED